MSDPQQFPHQPSPANPPLGAPAYGAPAQAPSHPQTAAGYPAAAPPYGTPAAPAQSGPPAYRAAPGYAAPAAPVGNPLGRVAFLIAAITVGVSVVSQLIYPLLYMSGSYGASSILTTVIGILVILGGAAALVLGIIALRRPEPRLLAAIAVGLAGTVVAGRLFGIISSQMYYVF